MRPAVLGNGRLYLGFDTVCSLREMFYPVIGLENHVAENDRSRLIVLLEDEVLEVDGYSWEAAGAYGRGMSFEWDIRCRTRPVSVFVTDVVDPYRPVWIRHLRVEGSVRSAGAYMRLALALKENTIGEAGFWDPKRKRLYHYKGPVWVAACVLGQEGMARVAKVSDGGAYLYGPNGEMSGHGVDHGLIESVIGSRFVTNPEESRVTLAFALGENRDEADAGLDKAQEAGLRGTLERTKMYWAGRDDVSTKVLVTHCDAGGAILASCDTGIMGDFRDHYRYVWHRDAAMCASTLIRQGLVSYGRRFLEYCANTLSEGGYFFQRYRADGYRGSGWHPADLPDDCLPIQEDETALSLVTAGEYLRKTGDLDFLHSIFDPFVSKAASFLLGYVWKDGALVKPSYDLWEERRGVFSYTQASCIAGLYWASMIAKALGRSEWKAYLEGSIRLLRGLVASLGSLESGFSRGLREERDSGSLVPDWTPDSSLYLIPLLLAPVEFPEDFGGREEGEALLDEIRAMSVQTWNRLNETVTVDMGDGVFGAARYVGDWYARPEGAGDLPGNVWLVCSAWRLLSGKCLGLLTREELAKESTVFEKARLQSGVMSEQLDCVRLRPVSVAPLVWSHAMYLDVRLAGLGIGALGTISHQ